MAERPIHILCPDLDYRRMPVRYLGRERIRVEGFLNRWGLFEIKQSGIAYNILRIDQGINGLVYTVEFPTAMEF